MTFWNCSSRSAPKKKELCQTRSPMHLHRSLQRPWGLDSAESSLNSGQGASVLFQCSVARLARFCGRGEWMRGGGAPAATHRPRFILRHPSAGILFAFPPRAHASEFPPSWIRLESSGGGGAKRDPAHF